jgi:hypothetical protein
MRNERKNEKGSKKKRGNISYKPCGYSTCGEWKEKEKEKRRLLLLL